MMIKNPISRGSSPRSIIIMVSSFVFILALAVNIFRFYSQTGNSKMTLEDIGYSEADPGEYINGDIEITDLESKVTSQKNLFDYRGKPFVLHFWATWCEPCGKEMPYMDEFSGKIDVPVLAIVADAELEAVKEYYEKKSVKKLLIVRDIGGVVSKKLKIDGLPTTIFVDSQGQEKGRITGVVEWQDPAIFKLIQSFLKGI